MSEEREIYNVADDNNKIIEHRIKFTITHKNKAKLHELVRELRKIDAIDKLDSEVLMVDCEVL